MREETYELIKEQILERARGCIRPVFTVANLQGVHNLDYSTAHHRTLTTVLKRMRQEGLVNCYRINMSTVWWLTSRLK